MAITFKSVGHFFATAYKDTAAALPKIIATDTTVEKVTGDIPVYGPLGVTVETAGYAVLGEISALLTTGGEAAAAKLTNAGLDEAVVTSVEALLKSIPDLVNLAKAL
jgi:hypothetical protein